MNTREEFNERRRFIIDRYGIPENREDMLARQRAINDAHDKVVELSTDEYSAVNKP